jgi:hypothetical protein
MSPEDRAVIFHYFADCASDMYTFFFVDPQHSHRMIQHKTKSSVRLTMPLLVSRCRCQSTQTMNTKTVKGMVITGKHHHRGDRVDTIPSFVVVLEKKTMLKIAYL